MPPYVESPTSSLLKLEFSRRCRVLLFVWVHAHMVKVFGFGDNRNFSGCQSLPIQAQRPFPHRHQHSRCRLTKCDPRSRAGQNARSVLIPKTNGKSCAGAAFQKWDRCTQSSEPFGRSPCKQRGRRTIRSIRPIVGAGLAGESALRLAK